MTRTFRSSATALSLPAALVGVLCVLAALLGSAPAAAVAAGAEGDEIRAATELLDELSVASVPPAAGNPESADPATPDGGDLAELLAEAPIALSRLEDRGLDVPSLARLMLSGSLPVDPGSDDGATALPVLFGAAADELRTLDRNVDSSPGTASSEESIGGESSDGGWAAPSIPWLALLGLVAVCCPGAASIVWYRRRAGRAEELSLVDPLTGLANRRRLDQDLARLESAREAARQPISVAMVDVDDFKRFNDTFGHAAGDVALQQVGSAIASAMAIDTTSNGAAPHRLSGSVYRYGGEEFLLLLRNAPKSEAVDACEAVRSAVSSLPNRITVSIGVATGTDEPLLTLTMAADEALYRAKANGRDQVIATSVTNRTGARVSSM